MKNLNYKNKEKDKGSLDLIAYAFAFVSFVLNKINVREIILFGSVARNEAGKDSDIDLFFDAEKNEMEIERTLKLEMEKFYKSKIAEIWKLRGIENKISLNVGKLKDWKLKRSIISEGITLYGKYKELPENIRKFTLFNLEPIKVIKKRNKVIRSLFGRKEKDYSRKGILEEFGGKKLSPTSFVIPAENSDKIIKILGKEKVSYRFFEVWSDSLSS